MFSSNASQVSNNVKYIEDVFSTWLRTGTGSSTTITTGLDASTNKALVWTKSRSAATDHKLTDTVRGATKALISNTTGAQTTDTNGLTAFSSTGYTIGSDTNYNNSGATYVDWEFVATPKFFDVVTYTGDSVTSTFAHNLGSVPGCIIVKRISSGGTNWQVYHRSSAKVGFTAAQSVLKLNTTDAVTDDNVWNNTAPTSTQFTVRVGSASVNANAETYVAYLFAHDAGGFGLTGTDNVISCGSFTSDIAGVDINLGYEPQWVMVKVTNGVGLGWYIWDNMRGFVASTSGGKTLEANSSSAEVDTNWISPTATGFKVNAGQISTGNPFIYIAIRRGPMKVPTDATKVFKPFAGADTPSITTNFVVDMFLDNNRSGNPNNTANGSRLVGLNALRTAAPDPETVDTFDTNCWQSNTSYLPNYFGVGESVAAYAFRRAPGFFDEVCYTGTGATSAAFSHNLGAIPEMMIVKSRSNSSHWMVYVASQGNTKELQLERTNAVATNTNTWGSTTPTSTQFTVGCISGIPDTESTNDSGYTYVAYLFATCPGVSKVFSFTGNGSTQTINCGFTGGARFVLLKASSATGGWFVYDTARGMTVLTDPYLQLNTTAAEVATLGSVTTVSTGFAVNEAITTGVNTNGVTYIGLAIA
jgi:hypothetical protein